MEFKSKTCDSEKARRILCDGDYTCILCKGDTVYTTSQRGVKPLVGWMMDDRSYAGFSAADKVVGRATAFLYCLLKVESVFAIVISRPALEILQSHGIITRYDLLVDHIINRKGDGICPFESAVLDILEPDAAFEVIREKMRQMDISL